MGMYTELIVGASFKKETPEELINTIKYMVGELTIEPKGYLWTEIRNPINWGSSFYFAVSSPVSKFYHDGYHWVLSSRCNIKNYNGEIETFIEMIRPWVNSGSGARDMFAMSIYEEASEPTIYYLEEF